MERLTYRGKPTMTEDGMITPTYFDYPTRRIIEQLADYEDAEENGLLLRLPCKVDEEVYCIKNMFDGKEICRNRVMSYQTAPNGADIVARGYMGVVLGIVGRTVFANYEEAEQALKQMGE